MKKKINFFDVCVTIIMALLVLCLAYPLYYTVIASFSGYEAIATGKVAFFPVVKHLLHTIYPLTT